MNPSEWTDPNISQIALAVQCILLLIAQSCFSKRHLFLSYRHTTVWKEKKKSNANMEHVTARNRLKESTLPFERKINILIYSSFLKCEAHKRVKENVLVNKQRSLYKKRKEFWEHCIPLCSPSTVGHPVIQNITLISFIFFSLLRDWISLNATILT